MSVDDDNRVCGDCIGDVFLRRRIQESKAKRFACHYCGKKAPTQDVLGIARLFEREFWQNYAPANNALREDRGHESLGYTIREVILKEVQPAGEELLEHLECLVLDLSQECFEYSSTSHPPDPDRLYEKIGVADWWLAHEWQEMLDGLLRQSRFFNPKAVQVLQTVFDPVLHDKTQTGDSVIVEVDSDHALGQLYRARVFQSDEELCKALADPESHLGPPPSPIAGTGRMNPRGISVFYGASMKEVALAEVRPPVGSKVAVAKFKLLRPVRLLDLTRFDMVPVMLERSLFDESTLKKAQRQKFISNLGRILSKPVLPDEAHSGYLITQVIADYLSANERLNLDGLIYQSVQVSNDEDFLPLNVVLFNKSSSVKKSLMRSGRNFRSQIYEYCSDTSQIYLSPQIFFTEDTADPWGDLSLDGSDASATLELQVESIEICEIEKVKYTTYDHAIKINCLK